MSVVLLALFGVAGFVWAGLAIHSWRGVDTQYEGRPLRILLWTISFTAVACSILNSLELDQAAQGLSAVAGVVFPGVLLTGSFGAVGIRGRSSHPVVPAALLSFSAVIAISALLNGQIGQVTWLIALGLLYLPGLTIAIWKTSASFESIRQTVRRVSVSVVWMSLAFTIIDLPHALGDLPRRTVMPGIEFRLAGVTPHPNLLAFTAAIALFLTIRAKPRFWGLHVLACAAVLYLAEARTLTVGVAIAAAGYWIVEARKSRMVRMFNTALVGAPIALFFWPTIMSSFDDSSLGSDVTTFNSRTLVWQMVADNWTEHPLLGWGAFTFDDMTGSPLSAMFFNNAHNQFLEALVEGGAVGLLLMAGVAAALVWSLATTRDAPYVAVAIMTLFFMMTEVPLTLHNYGFSYIVVLGALLLAILIPGPIRQSAKVADSPEKASRPAPHLTRLERALQKSGVSTTTGPPTSSEWSL